MFLTFLIFFFFYNFAHSYSIACILGLLVNFIDTPNYAFTQVIQDSSFSPIGH